MSKLNQKKKETLKLEEVLRGTKRDNGVILSHSASLSGVPLKNFTIAN